MLLTFWLRNVLRATTARTFSTSQLRKMVRSTCFVHFDLEMCFVPQRRALFPHRKLAFSTSSFGSTPPLTSSTCRSSPSGSTAGISGTWSCAQRINSVQFTSFFQFSFQTFEHSSYKLRLILCRLLGYATNQVDVAVPWCSTCLICALCFQQFCQSWMVRHPPGLFTHKACPLQASTVCSRHAPLAHRASHHVHIIPWGYALSPFHLSSSLHPTALHEESISLAGSASHTHHTMCGDDALLLSFFSLWSLVESCSSLPLATLKTNPKADCLWSTGALHGLSARKEVPRPLSCWSSNIHHFPLSRKDLQRTLASACTAAPAL